MAYFIISKTLGFANIFYSNLLIFFFRFFFCRLINIQNTGKMNTGKYESHYFMWIFVHDTSVSAFVMHKIGAYVFILMYRVWIHQIFSNIYFLGDHGLSVHENQRRIVVNLERINCVHQKLLLACKPVQIVVLINQVWISGLHVKSPILVIDELIHGWI